MTSQRYCPVTQRTRLAFAGLAALITLAVLGCVAHIAAAQSRNAQLAQAGELPLQIIVITGKRV